MDVREKLVEFLYECVSKNMKPRIIGEKPIIEIAHGDIANHLISHGVTVQERGHWEIIMDDYDCEMMQCSVCEEMFYDGDNDTVDCLHNYCPHCGAKMMPQPPKGE